MQLNQYAAASPLRPQRRGERQFKLLLPSCGVGVHLVMEVAVKLLVKLEKEDIVTRVFYNNIEIRSEAESVGIILSPDAARELVGDLTAVLMLMDEKVTHD